MVEKVRGDPLRIVLSPTATLTFLLPTKQMGTSLVNVEFI